MIYAAYGSNMNMVQMRSRCPAAQFLATAWLKGYMLTFRGDRRGVANIERKKGAQVPVVLWEITKGCEAVLDVYEGYPHLYVKKNITVTTRLGDRVSAMAYVMSAKYDSMPAIPDMQYYDIIRQGYVENQIDISSLEAAYSKVFNEIKDKER